MLEDASSSDVVIEEFSFESATKLLASIMSETSSSNLRQESGKLVTPFGVVMELNGKKVKSKKYNSETISLFISPNEATANSFYNLIIEQKSGQGNWMYIIEYENDQGELGAKFDSKFTGWLRRYDLEGKLLSEERIEQGSSIVVNQNGNNARVESSNCYTESDFVDWTVCKSSSYGSYCYEETTVESSEMCAGTPEIDGGSSGGSSGGGYVVVVQPPRVRELKLTPSFTSNQKAMCIWNKINSNGFFTSMMQSFVGDTEFDVEVKIEPSLFNEKGEEVNGKAIWRGPDLPILIQYSNAYLSSAASIRVARTFLHEIIHAEIFRYQNTSLPIGTEITEMLSLGSHHEVMSINYVNQLASALNSIHHNFDYQLYANFLNYPEGVPLPFYEALAWEGLRTENPVYEKLSTKKKTEIDNWLRDAREILTSTCN